LDQEDVKFRVTASK